MLVSQKFKLIRMHLNESFLSNFFFLLIGGFLNPPWTKTGSAKANFFFHCPSF